MRTLQHILMLPSLTANGKVNWFCRMTVVPKGRHQIFREIRCIELFAPSCHLSLQSSFPL